MRADPLTGSCSCGRVTYAIEAEPRFSFHCQCQDCQRWSGTGHASLIMFSADAITLQGEIRFFEQENAEGIMVRRGFCPSCGGPVVNENPKYPDVRFIHAGSLADPTLFTPTKVVWTRSAQAWDRMDPELDIG